MSNNNLTLSQARWNANRENAQHSTGPRTDAGRLISSKNAVKTALTGRTVLLPTDDADRYESHIEAFRSEWAPKGQRELYLVQSVADAGWRLERIATFEMTIYAKETTFVANAFNDEPPAIQTALIELEIQRIHEREFRNLHLQEARIRRQRDRDIAELRYLQAERKRLQEEELALAAEALKQAKAGNKPFDPSELGFVFSTAEIERFLTLQKLRKDLAAAKTQPQTSSTRRLKVA